MKCLKSGLINVAAGLMMVVGICFPASAGQIWTFYTGESYLNAPEPAHTLYVAGMSDTLIALTDSGDINTGWVVSCTNGMHSSELTAMFDRWLVANPALLGKSAPL